MEIELHAIRGELAKNKKDEVAKQKVEDLQASISHIDEELQPIMARFQAEKAKSDEIQQVKKKIDELKAKAEDAERRYDLATAADIGKFNSSFAEGRSTLAPLHEPELLHLSTSPFTFYTTHQLTLLTPFAVHGALPDLAARLQVLENQKREEDTAMRASGGEALAGDTVTPEHIQAVVSQWSGIPVTSLRTSEKQKLLRMEKTLRKSVIGQEEAVKAVSDAIRLSRSGLSNQDRPIASFLFVGPSGTGKTELSKALARFLFDSPDAMVRIDVSILYPSLDSARRLPPAPRPPADLLSFFSSRDRSTARSTPFLVSSDLRRDTLGAKKAASLPSMCAASRTRSCSSTSSRRPPRSSFSFSSKFSTMDASPTRRDVL